MKLFTPILTFLSMYCYSQSSYERLLSSRIGEIKELLYYNNSVVVYDESSGYGTNHASWNSTEDYYTDDIVLYQDGKVYRALVDSKGKTPSISTNEWEAIPFRHPYLFLRDTARTQDLKKLLLNKHPYVKTYAFGALANKKEAGLYGVILNNLSDTTKLDQMTGDYGYYVCPADLMISYLAKQMTADQRSELKKLILTKYRHLKESEIWLREE